MRTTKTLLIAAAALAATVTASQAQTVYSQNVVGYINVSVPANSFALVGNQLDLGPGSNKVNNVLSSGLISYSGGAGNGASESTLLIWSPSIGNYVTFLYYNAADATPLPAGWYDLSGNPCTNDLGPSQAAFLQNTYTSPITVTLTGQVDQGTNTWSPVTPGFNFYSEPVALAGTPLDSTNVNFPATSYTAGGGNPDAYQAWTGTGYGPVYLYYNTSDAAPSPAGWYNLAGTVDEDTNPPAWPTVGAGFLVEHFGATSNWVQTFQVQ